MRIPCDETPDDDDVAVTASRGPQFPDVDVPNEPPAEEPTGGDEEAGYGYGVWPISFFTCLPPDSSENFSPAENKKNSETPPSHPAPSTSGKETPENPHPHYKLCRLLPV